MVFAYLGNGPTLTPSRAWKVHLGWDFPACRFLFRAYTGYMTPLLLYLRYLIQKRSFHMDGVASLMEDSMNIKKKIMLDM